MGTQSPSDSELPAQRAKLLAAAVVVESAGGLFYAFSLYSESLKRACGLSQLGLQLIGTCANVGANVGVHAGLFYDRHGPRRTAALGMALGGVGWAGMWLAVSTRRPVPLAALALFALLQGQGQLAADCAAVPTVAAAFAPQQYTLALGLTKSVLGLSGSLAAQLYASVIAPPPEAPLADVDDAVSRFLCAVTVWSVGACALGARALRPPSCGRALAQRAVRGAEREASDRWLSLTFAWMLLLVAILIAAALFDERARALTRAWPDEPAGDGDGDAPLQRVLGCAALGVFGALVVHCWRGPEPVLAPRAQPLRPPPAAAADGWGGARGASRAPPPARPQAPRPQSHEALPILVVAEVVEAGGEADYDDVLVATLLASPTRAEDEAHARADADAAVVVAVDAADDAAPADADADADADVGLRVFGIVHAAAAARHHAPDARAAHDGGWPAVVAASGSSAALAALACASAASPASPARAADGLSLRGALCGVTFWVHFACHFSMAAPALFLINNLGQIERALDAGPALEGGGGARGVAALVSILSACNCLGRLGAAGAAEAAARAGLSRTAPLAAAALLMSIAMGCVASHSRAALLPACALCGLSLGALNSLNAVLVGGLYGHRAFGAIYLALALAGALGSALVASGLAVRVYNAHTPPGARECEGAGCFRETALFCALLSAGGVGCALALARRPLLQPPGR